MDLHSYLRLRSLIGAAPRGRVSIIELGCASGLNLVRICEFNHDARAVGYDTSDAVLAQGRRMIECAGLSQRIQLISKDLAAELPVEISDADYVLLIDVLEHLPDPIDSARKISERLKPGAHLLVSVPTPLYPRVFGRRFHDEIGHLHDGFPLEYLDTAFSGLERLRSSYSTGVLTWPGIRIFYGWHAKGKFVTAAKVLSTLPFRYLDWFNGPRRSCSLFAEFRKPPQDNGDPEENACVLPQGSALASNLNGRYSRSKLGTD
jgi:SAM-dependent methyltransferase